MSMFKAFFVAKFFAVLVVIGFVYSLHIPSYEFSGFAIWVFFLWVPLFFAFAPRFSTREDGRNTRYKMYGCLFIGLLLSASATALLSQMYPRPDFVPAPKYTSINERDQCVSELRGIAEQNAHLQGFTIVTMGDGGFSYKANGNVSCSASFVVIKDGKQEVSKIFVAEVAKSKK